MPYNLTMTPGVALGVGILVLVVVLLVMEKWVFEGNIKNGLPTTATIESISSEHFTVGRSRYWGNPAYKLVLMVTPPGGGAPYRAVSRHLIPMGVAGFLNPGAQINVLVDPHKPSRVVPNFSGGILGGVSVIGGANLMGGASPIGARVLTGQDAVTALKTIEQMMENSAARAGATSAVTLDQQGNVMNGPLAGGAAAANPLAALFGAGGIGTAGALGATTFPGDTATALPAVTTLPDATHFGAAGIEQTTTGSAGHLLATGTRATAVIVSARPLGKKVRDVDPSAETWRLDAPIWAFTVEVALPGRSPVVSTFGHWVPDNKVGSVFPGAKLAVAFDESNPTQACAIDWDHSPIS